MVDPFDPICQMSLYETQNNYGLIKDVFYQLFHIKSFRIRLLKEGKKWKGGNLKIHYWEGYTLSSSNRAWGNWPLVLFRNEQNEMRSVSTCKKAACNLFHALPVLPLTPRGAAKWFYYAHKMVRRSRKTFYLICFQIQSCPDQPVFFSFPF